jgi:hypothetical protein
MGVFKGKTEESLRSGLYVYVRITRGESNRAFERVRIVGTWPSWDLMITRADKVGVKNGSFRL